MSLNLSQDKLNSMRAFLQRAEVRLSTMHRIVGAFLGGAGLLLVFPLLLKDAIPKIINQIIQLAIIWKEDTLLYICLISLILGLIVSLVIPLYALYLLIKDIVLFYFQGHIPGFSQDSFIPRFALTSLSLPTENETTAFPDDLLVKGKIKDTQKTDDMINFIIPQQELEAKYYDNIISAFGNRIISEKQHSELSQNYVTHPNNNDRLLTALGLTGYYERSIIEEVAKIEISLARHSLALRRLVLRYAKALLIVIFTFLGTYSLLAMYETNLLTNFQILLYTSIFCMVWGFGSLYIIQKPMTWIHVSSSNIGRDIKNIYKDGELVKFELRVKWAKWITIIIGIFTIIIFSIYKWNGNII